MLDPATGEVGGSRLGFAGNAARMAAYKAKGELALDELPDQFVTDAAACAEDCVHG
jgi:hypothetical protein